MSNGDFTNLAHELSAFVSNLVFEKNASRDDELTRAEINKLKGKLFGSLPAIFNSTEAATRVISRFVLTPNSENKTLPQLILEETESYPPQTGYMCEPITFPREDHFQVLTGQDIDWDAAWRVLFFLLRLKCADLSAEAAQDEIKNLKMLAGEDPNALRDRLVGLVERVNLPHDSTSKVISLQTAGLFMLQALPEHLAGIVRERFSKAMNVTDEYTLTEVTEVAQDVHTRLKSMETKIMKANLEQENLIQYVGAYAEGPTKSTLADMLITGQRKHNLGLPSQPLITPRTSTTRSASPRRRLPAPRAADSNFDPAGLNNAGRKLLSQITRQAPTSSFNAEPAAVNPRATSNVCSENLGGPNGDCTFCHKPLHLFHSPTLPCHISGKTTLYDSWVNQGKMPAALRPLMNMLIVNHDRVAKGQKPLTKVEFDQQFGSSSGNLNSSNHAVPAGNEPPSQAPSYDYHSVPPPTRHSHHVGQQSTRRADATPTDAAPTDTIIHYHSYAAIVEHGNPFLRGASNPTTNTHPVPRDEEVAQSPGHHDAPGSPLRSPRRPGPDSPPYSPTSPTPTHCWYSPASPAPNEIPEQYPDRYPEDYPTGPKSPSPSPDSPVITRHLVTRAPDSPPPSPRHDDVVSYAMSPPTLTREQRVAREESAMSNALVRHVPDGNAPVNTFDIAYAVIRFEWAEYPTGPNGKPMRIGNTRVCCRDHAHDQYGLPTCCMAHRKNPENWQPPRSVIDLVTSDDDVGSDTEGYDESHEYHESTADNNAPSAPTPPVEVILHPLHHHSYMARSMVNHRHIPASFRRTGSTPIPTPAAPVAVRGREEEIANPPSATPAMVLMKTNDWLEEDHDEPPQSLSAALSTTTANHQQVPPAELHRLTSKACEEMSPDMTDWFRRTAVCYTLCNDDPKKSILVMSQRTGQYLTLSVMIVDTGSMLFVMNKVHQEMLGLKVHSSMAIVDTSMGSGGTQQHRQWGKGELMLVIAPGTSNEMVLADVTGISPSAHVNFDVLLSVDILHAMSAGVLPATPERGAALAYHPHNQRGDFVHKAYLPLKPALAMLIVFLLLAACINPAQAHNEEPDHYGSPYFSLAATLLTIISLGCAVAASMAAVIQWRGHQQRDPDAWPFAHFRINPPFQPFTLFSLAPWHRKPQASACQFCNSGTCRGANKPHACHLGGGTGLYARWVRDGKVPSHLMPLLMLVVNTGRVTSGQAPLTHVTFRQQYGPAPPSSETPETPNPSSTNSPNPETIPNPTSASTPPPADIVSEPLTSKVCEFCEQPMEKYHHPTLPCHISGDTNMFDKWVPSQAERASTMPVALRKFKHQLTINHNRRKRNLPPFTRAEYLLRFPDHTPPPLPKPHPNEPPSGCHAPPNYVATIRDQGAVPSTPAAPSTTVPVHAAFSPYHNTPMNPGAPPFYSDKLGTAATTPPPTSTVTQGCSCLLMEIGFPGYVCPEHPTNDDPTAPQQTPAVTGTPNPSMEPKPPQAAARPSATPKWVTAITLAIFLVAALPAATAAATLDPTNNHANPSAAQIAVATITPTTLATVLLLAACIAATLWIIPKARHQDPSQHAGGSTLSHPRHHRHPPPSPRRDNSPPSSLP
ncbi:hypothetical protein CYMTET_8695 [Cymbomonas tetramitiformis]|uniref:Uncharacterized protein n=1 Tax=Cymbomonas tetramitiformis TaxID=36881 RepID=A0AAE0LFU5_9CHLO|nr:hypothetical protein CYMTET_8695 [Cymbomonas tetramitiformis]